MNYDLLCVGDVNLDLITSPIKNYPKKDTQIGLDIHPHIGGEAANTALNAAKLGMKTCFIGAIGKDHAGNFVKDKMKHKNLHAKLIEKPARTAKTVAITFENGNRTFLTDSGANKKLKFSDISLDLVRNSKSVFRAGYWHNTSLLNGGNTRLFKYAKQNNIQTCLGLGWNYLGWSDKWRRQLFQNLKYVDTTFLNHKELSDITKEKSLNEGCSKLLKYTNTLIVHLGKKGSHIQTKDESVTIPTKKVKTLNPVGTGDMFNAAFIKGMLNNWSLQRSAAYANKNAAGYASRKA